MQASARDAAGSPQGGLTGDRTGFAAFPLFAAVFSSVFLFTFSVFFALGPGAALAFDLAFARESGATPPTDALRCLFAPGSSLSACTFWPVSPSRSGSSSS